MREEMIKYVRLHDPVSSLELAQQFLKFKNPVEAMAHAAIKGILATDKRCCFGDDGLWHYAGSGIEGPAEETFSDTLFAAIFLLSLPRNLGGKPLHISIWTVDETPGLLYDAWLEDPDLLPQDEQEALRSIRDRPFAATDHAEVLSICENKVPVFLSSRDMALFSEGIAAGESWPMDEALVISTLMKAAKVPLPRPLTIDACYQTLRGEGPALSYAYKYGECLARCVRELLTRLRNNGIAGRRDLETLERDDLSSFDFSRKGFCFEDIANAPALPGVYGFKTKADCFLYIGKASNLRRRLMGYFRRTDESPEKIARIRAEAYSLITSVCGSELESLIYEYRLVKKHRPVLNTQVSINERKGDFRPIDDCVIMLPHADCDKGMAFLFRKNRRILLRPFFTDFREAAALIAELNDFFFNPATRPLPEDFPEQEIATRWVKRRPAKGPVVLINRVTNAQEAFDAMRSAWKELSGRNGNVTKEREERE